MGQFESLEDEALLDLVDKYYSRPIHSPFETEPRIFDASIVEQKETVDRLIELYPKPVASKSVAILDGLVYKMSAPYRHAKFWRFTRRVLKELKKLNALKLIKYLKVISNGMLKSELRYGLNIHSKQYIVAMIISRAIRGCRLRNNCERAALHCLQHIQTGHLLESNLLLLALNADIYDQLKEDMNKLVKCFNCVLLFITDSSLLQVKTLLETTKKKFKTSSCAITSMESLRPIVELCGIDTNEYTYLPAFRKMAENEKRCENKSSVPSFGKEKEHIVERHIKSMEELICTTDEISLETVKTEQNDEINLTTANVPRENGGIELSSISEEFSKDNFPVKNKFIYRITENKKKKRKKKKKKVKVRATSKR